MKRSQEIRLASSGIQGYAANGTQNDPLSFSIFQTSCLYICRRSSIPNKNNRESARKSPFLEVFRTDFA